MSFVWLIPGVAIAQQAGAAGSDLTIGPDLTISDINQVRHWTTSGPVDGFRAYSLGTASCNIGDTSISWLASPNPNHPVIAPAMYRLENGQFEQIGIGWVRHNACAIQQGTCGTCIPGDVCIELGAGCSTVNSATTNGSAASLGPRSEINAGAGTNLGAYAFPSGPSSLAGRLLVRDTDLDPTLHPAALYFVEAQHVAFDDAESGDRSNDNNNASTRPVTLNPDTFNMFPTEQTSEQLPAIRVWEQIDAAVQVETVDIVDDGRLLVAHRVMPLGDGVWRYEYAVHNLNAHRSVGAWSIALPSSDAEPDGDSFTHITLTNVGFHDVDYHSGEPFDPTDWPAEIGSDLITWSTQLFDENPNANALRWGTLYNFRFDANAPPHPGVATIGLFRPAVPDTVTLTVQTPAILGDVNDDNAVDIADVAMFQDCQTGPFIVIENPNCAMADLDADSDVDFADFAVLQRMIQ